MILVDTSVWVDFFRAPDSPIAREFDAVLGSVEILVGDLILVELLQGLREGPQLREVEDRLEPFRKVPLCGTEIARKAAANFRALRRRGITVRGKIDVVIATWCVENELCLLHNDRDFRSMQDALGLRSWT